MQLLIGASQRGYRPVAEMQFADFITCAFDQIVNQAATLRFRYGGRATVPIVVRAPSGGNVGGGLYHSQNPEAWFTKNEPSGFILTTILGIVGAFVATYLGQAIGWYHADEGAGLIGAVVGAVIILLIWGFISGRRSPSP